MIVLFAVTPRERSWPCYGRRVLGRSTCVLQVRRWPIRVFTGSSQNTKYSLLQSTHWKKCGCIFNLILLRSFRSMVCTEQCMESHATLPYRKVATRVLHGTIQPPYLI